MTWSVNLTAHRLAHRGATSWGCPPSWLPNGPWALIWMAPVLRRMSRANRESSSSGPRAGVSVTRLLKRHSPIVQKREQETGCLQRPWLFPETDGRSHKPALFLAVSRILQLCEVFFPLFFCSYFQIHKGKCAKFVCNWHTFFFI